VPSPATLETAGTASADWRAISSHPTPETIVAPELRRFNSSELRLSREQALRVLRFFFLRVNISAADLTEQDIAFAQGLLVQAIDSSYQMGFVQVIADVFWKVPANLEIADLVIEFGKGAAKNWFRHATQKDLMSAKIYESVRTTVRANFQTVWDQRMSGLELTY